jgi:drug/metabolite transporter (DMT)-like permease
LATTTLALWGVLPLALGLALRRVDAATLTWFRFLVAAILLGGWFAARGALPRLGALGRSDRWLLAVATVALAVNYIAYLTGLDRTTPANAQVLIQTAPLLLGLGGVLVFGESYTRMQWTGFGIIVAGLAAFFASQLSAFGLDTGRYRSGVALIGTAAATWAVYGLAQKQLLRVLTPQGVMLCIYAGCTVAFWPFAAPGTLRGLSLADAVVIGFCALNTLVAYGAFAAALAHAEASRVSAVLALTPLATLAFSAAAGRWLPGFVAPESLSFASWSGAALVVAGSLATALGGRSADAGGVRQLAAIGSVTRNSEPAPNSDVTSSRPP